MNKHLIESLNKILTNTLDYKEVLQKLASSISHRTTADKLDEFAKVCDREAKRLIKLIPDIGGQVESTERQTDQEAVAWVSRPLPDTENMQSILACLIEAERNKENDYNTILGHDSIDRETKNLLTKHRKEAESNLTYFQSAMQALETKVRNEPGS